MRYTTYFLLVLVTFSSEIAAEPLGLPAVPIPNDNRQSQVKIALGQRLFEDRRFSADGIISCASCHEAMLDIGCTAQLLNQNACLITAGHCLSASGVANVVEFNVPPSNPDVVHSRPDDQYVLTNVRDFVDGGVGNDWGVFTVHPNADTGLTPFEAQGAHLNLSNNNPLAGDTIEIVGYGVDSGADSQTQQISFGPVTSASGTTASYQSDTEGGNSGSAVTLTGEVVAIHSHSWVPHRETAPIPAP